MGPCWNFEEKRARFSDNALQTNEFEVVFDSTVDREFYRREKGQGMDLEKFGDD